MNNPGSRNSGSSPGFVYFNKASSQNFDNTADFIAFQESPKQNDRYSLPNYGTPQFHSSPRQFNVRNNYRYSGRNRGNRPYHSPNNSYNSWNNQRSPRQHHHKKGQLFKTSPMMSADGKRDMSMFYDHTCTWNPWDDLEKKLEAERASEKAIEVQSTVVDKKEATIEDGTNKKEQSSSSGDEDSSSTNEESSNSEEEAETT